MPQLLRQDRFVKTMRRSRLPLQIQEECGAEQGLLQRMDRYLQVFWAPELIRSTTILIIMVV